MIPTADPEQYREFLNREYLKVIDREVNEYRLDYLKQLWQKYPRLYSNVRHVSILGSFWIEFTLEPKIARIILCEDGTIAIFREHQFDPEIDPLDFLDWLSNAQYNWGSIAEYIERVKEPI